MDNTTVINLYIQFIYSTLEYSIVPLVKIGLDIYVKYPKWDFGRNVIGTLEECKKKYIRKTFGNLNYDNSTEKQQLILSAIKDYGMLGLLKNINVNILDEINSHLKLRY